MEKERQDAVINATPNCTFGSLRGNGNAFTALRLYFLIELMFICLCVANANPLMIPIVNACKKHGSSIIFCEY